MKKSLLALAIAAAQSQLALAGHDDDQHMVIEINQGLPQLETAIRETTTGVKASPVSDGAGGGRPR